MRKGTIFRYEFRRLFFSRAYLLLAAGSLLYGVSLLRSAVLFGTMYTAPFSRWTFCGYLSSLSPLLLILLLVLSARQFAPSERGAAAIIGAAPLPEPVFLALRYGAVACAFLIAAVLPVAACFAFYWAVFDYTAFGAHIVSAVLLLVPPAVFVLGAAMLLGRRKTYLIYVLLAAVLILGVFGIRLPAAADVFGSTVTAALQDGGSAFAFTAPFVAGRAILLAAGAALVAVSLKPGKKRARP